MLLGCVLQTSTGLIISLKNPELNYTTLMFGFIIQNYLWIVSHAGYLVLGTEIRFLDVCRIMM